MIKLQLILDRQHTSIIANELIPVTKIHYNTLQLSDN